MRTIKREEILLFLRPGRPGANAPCSASATVYAASAYIGCQHNCNWQAMGCDAKEEARRRGKQWGYPDWFVGNIKEEWPNPLVVENALELLERELESKKPGRVILSPMSDPYQPLEEDLGLTRAIIERLPCPVTIHTRATDLPARDFDLLSHKSDCWFGVSISREGRAAQDRSKLLQEAKGKGMRTFVYLAPWLPGEDALHIMASLKGIVDLWFIGPLLNEARRPVDPEFYERELPRLLAWLEKEGLRYKVHIAEELLRAARINKLGSGETKHESIWWSLVKGAHLILGSHVVYSEVNEEGK